MDNRSPHDSIEPEQQSSPRRTKRFPALLVLIVVAALILILSFIFGYPD